MTSPAIKAKFERACFHRQRGMRAYRELPAMDWNLQQVAIDVANRIRGIRHADQCGTWVFGDTDGRVYLVAEVTVLAPRLVEEHVGWLVGLFAARDGKGGLSYPTGPEMFEALEQHFIDLDVIPKPVLRVRRYAE